jgi:hypothetical protein
VTESRTLQTLTYEDLQRYPAWLTREDTLGEEDAVLLPVVLTADGDVPAERGIVWCLAKATFASGAAHHATAAIWPAGTEGPLLPSVWNGARFVPLFVPPAPDFVLAKDGPGAFASAFGLNVTEVFPLKLEVVPSFAIAPRSRAAVYAVEGRIPALD